MRINKNIHKYRTGSTEKSDVLKEMLLKYSKEQFIEFIQKLVDSISDCPCLNIIKRAGVLYRLSGTVFKNWIKCFVVLSHDNNLHVYDNDNDVIPSKSIRVKNTQVY